MKYTNHFSTNDTPQTEPIPGSTQKANNAGGFSWEVNDWTKLDRFLILGNEGGSYYATEKEMTLKNCNSALACLATDGIKVVKRIIEISVAGRAPKNDPAIFLLAMAAGWKDAATRSAALEALPLVCRTGTHLFQFLDAVQNFRGWGRGLRRAVGSWYTGKVDDGTLAYQLVKYRQRGGWAHRDALRLAKPAAGNVPVLKWAVGKEADNLPALIQAFIAAEKAEGDKEIIRILGDCPALPWEAIPSQHLKSDRVWEALLPSLPMTAMIRNLGRMTANGLLAPMSAAALTVSARLRDPERIAKARVHPIAVLGALCTYKGGHGIKGNLEWTPVPQIVDAIDEAFYLAFGNVQPSNKRTLLALDVSGSMGYGTIASMPGVTPRVGSAAMAMVTARTEPNWAVMGFSDKFLPLAISPRQRLDDICSAIEGLPFDRTDCSLPMQWAMQAGVKIDTFVVYTDSETYAGHPHPAQALAQYRQKTGIAAKLIVVGMTASEFTIADPADAGMMDVVGFDTAAPEVMRQFASC